MNEQNEIEDIIDRLLRQGLSETEKQILSEKLKDISREELDQLLSASWEKFEPGKKMEDARAGQLLENILLKGRQVHPAKQTVTRMYSRRWVAVAAAVLVVVSSVTIFLLVNRGGKAVPLADAPAPQNDRTAPGVSRALITLADGEVVYLDSAASGTVAREGKVSVQKLADGTIAYTGSDNQTLFNTLTNPKGSKVISMTFSDGSQVWLNAGSSVRFPVAFERKKREVTITGEAYFEVSHDASRPFIVIKGDSRVDVLGTHFNVNAYDDEPDVKVTLLEGAVRVKLGEAAGLLRPGQQAILGSAEQDKQSNQAITINGDIDTDEVMAWKNGEFQFGEKSDIQAIMRQISRWYNVEIEYKGNVTGQYWGSVSRSVNISQVLKLLEKTGAMNFTLEGNKVIISP